MTLSPARSPWTPAASAQSDAPSLAAVALALPVTTHQCLVPIETPLSQDGELSARNAQHRTSDHFEAVVHDTTWLLNHALSGKRQSHQSSFQPSGLDSDVTNGLGSSAHDPDANTKRTSSSNSAGDFYANAKTRRQVSAQAQRAFALFRLSKFARAVHDYDACLATEPASAVLYYNRGCAFYAWGKKDRAVTDLTRALKLDCKNALFVESRAIVNKELGRFHEAIQDYAWLETLRRMAQHTKSHRESAPDLGARLDSVTDSTAPASPLGSTRGSFSMSFSELQATLMGATISGSSDSDFGSSPLAIATDGLSTEEREKHVREWMIRFLQRSPRGRKRSDVAEAVAYAKSWSFFRGMDAAMVEQCMEDAVYASYDSDAVVVHQGQYAQHFHVVLNPTAPFVKNIDAQSGISKLRELKKLSQGDAVGTDAFAVSFGDGVLRTIRHDIAHTVMADGPSFARLKSRRGQRSPDRHGSLDALLASQSTLAMLTPSNTTSDASATLLPPEPASFTALEPVHCLLLDVDAYREILHDHEERVLDERVAFLRGCRVFQSCSDEVLTALAAVSGARVYDPGKDLLRTGDDVSQLCIIQRGVCQVRKTIHVPALPSAPTTHKKRLSPLRRRRGNDPEKDERDHLASARSSDDGSWVLDNGWMLTNPRLVTSAQGDAKQVLLIPQDVDVGILASGQVFGELSVLQPGQPSQVTIHSQTLVELLVFAQSDLARLQVQYHSGTMNALQESLLFHNPPQQKIVQLQRDLARWDKQKRSVLSDLALQLPTKAQSVLASAVCMKARKATTTAPSGPALQRRRATLVAVPPLSPLTRHKSIKLIHTTIQ